MIKVWLCLLGSLVYIHLTAQTNVVISSAEDKKTLPNAHIICTSLNGSTQKPYVADLNGRVLIGRPFSQIGEPIVLQISYVGFQEVVDTLLAGAHKMYFLEPQQVHLNQLVITGQFAPTNPEKSVHKMKIIDRKKIDAMGANTLNEVLTNETNMRVGQDNILGSSLSVQGISGENVKILIDGVPVVGRLNGNVDLSQINLNNIERIEIVEGPLSVNYGTNALAGTIHLFTKKNQQKTWNISNRSYYETVGQYNTDARLSWQKKQHQFAVSGGRNYFDGWSEDDPFLQFPKKLPADTNRFKSWNPKEQLFFQTHYRWQWNELSLRAYWSWFDEKIVNRGYPRAPYLETAFDDHYATSRIDKGLQINGKLTPNGYIDAVFAHNRFERTKNTWFTDLTTLQQDLTESVEDQDSTSFEQWMSRATFSLSNDTNQLSLQVGYDVNIEEGKGNRIEAKRKQIGDYALFVNASIKPTIGLTIQPGLRYAYNTAYDAPVVPSLHIRHQWGKITSRISYARGFRSPSIKELYFDFVDINHNIQGSQNLLAETSSNYQFSVGFKSLKNQQIFSIDAGGFYNNVRNLITLGNVAGTNEFSYFNIGEFRTFGFSLNGAWNVRHLKVSMGAQLNGRTDQSVVAFDAQKIYYTPEYRSSFTYGFAKHKISFNAFYKYTGKTPQVQVNELEELVQSELEAYHWLDLSVSKKWWKDRLTWTVGGKNLLNVTQINATSTSSSAGGVHSGGGSIPVGWGTSVFSSIKLNLDF